MPPVRKQVAGLSLSDLHQTLAPPPLRCVEKDWLLVLRRYWEEIKIEMAFHPNVPIILAGDIFDQWKVTPEIINFLLETMPYCDIYGIPGQHDLPFHSYAEIKKSAYWTLVAAGRIKNLEPGVQTSAGSLNLYGFPWEHPITRPVKDNGLSLNVAVVHAYIWKEERSDNPFPEDSTHWKKYIPQLKGYDVAVFGDNHMGFKARHQKKNDRYLTIVNNGCFLRRRAQEISYTPSFSIIYADGSVERRPFRCAEKDQFLERAELIESLEKQYQIDMTGFLEEIRGVADRGIDYVQIMKQRIRKAKVPSQVRKIILEILEGIQHAR